MTRFGQRRYADLLAGLILLILWVAFFWRFITPVEADQVSLVEGDFSGQFVAFGAYQAERLWAGEVPLWNPYNNGGLPFLADNQSAVFYPPRLLTIALASFSHRWTYYILELEMMAHVLLASFLMYAFVRRLTIERSGSVVGGLVAALTWSYGGFMTGYPPLQLAVLEAAVWGPLVLLGIHEATKTKTLRWAWLALSGFALGLSVMAGHPQTNWFIGWLMLAFLVYRIYRQRWSWRCFVAGAALIGGLAVLLALVQLLPAAEYLMHTTRIDFGFEAKHNGFPIHDVIQMLFPRLLSEWSPLYVGVFGLILVAVALGRRVLDWAFWGGAGLVGLLFGFGGNAALYGILYNIMPGLKLFRGQERAAVVVAIALSVLAGLGTAALLDRDRQGSRMLVRGLGLLLAVTGFATLVAFVLWLGPAQESYDDRLPAMAFSTLMAGLALLTIPWLLRGPGRVWRQAAVVALIVFDLFTLAADNLLTQPVPASERLLRPAVLDVVFADDDVPPSRVDGQRGVLANFGTMWGIPDIRGISPLWLQGSYEITGAEFPNPLAWELFAVRYVFTDWQELPVSSTIVEQGDDAYGPVNAHLLEDPRPFALLMDSVGLVDSDAFAAAVLADPAFNPRASILLDERGGLTLPVNLHVEGTATVVSFAPEAIRIAIDGQDSAAVLSVALPHYPGWKATVDGQAVPVVRAYGGLSALVLPASAEQVDLVYDPISFKLGALGSILGWGGLLLYGLMLGVGWLRAGAGSRSQ